MTERPNFGRRRLPRYRAHVREGTAHPGVYLVDVEHSAIVEVWSGIEAPAQASNLITTVMCDEIDDRDAEIETLRADVAWAEKEIATAEAQIETLRADLFACEFKVGTKDAEIEILRAEVRTMRSYARHRHTCPKVTGGNLACDCGFDDLFRAKAT